MSEPDNEDEPDWEIVSHSPFRIELVADIERARAVAEKRRSVAAELLARLTAARDALSALDPFPLVNFPRGDPGGASDVPEPELARRAEAYKDLRDVLDAVRPQLLVAERLLRRLHGPEALAAPATLAALRAHYEGVDDPLVVAALERRPTLAPLLLAAVRPMRAHFGERVTLHLLPPYRFHDGGEDESLHAVARGHGLTLEAAMEREAAFYDAWPEGLQDPAARFVGFGLDHFAENPAAPTQR